MSSDLGQPNSQPTGSVYGTDNADAQRLRATETGSSAHAGSTAASDDKASVDAEGYTSAAISGSHDDLTLRKTPWRPRTTPWSEIVACPYKGSGTNEDPFLVQWLSEDPENPLTFANGFKAQATFTAAFSCLAVSMSSSMLSAAMLDIRKHYPGLSNELYIMGRLHIDLY